MSDVEKVMALADDYADAQGGVEVDLIATGDTREAKEGRERAKAALRAEVERIVAERDGLRNHGQIVEAQWRLAEARIAELERALTELLRVHTGPKLNDEGPSYRAVQAARAIQEKK